jgi:cobalt-zinc-cadmium efflux system protein
MSANHNHSADASIGKAFLISLCLNSLIVLAEIIFGTMAHSMALLADAGHTSIDLLGLILSWAAFRMSKIRPAGRFTYGLKRSTLLATLLSGLLLLLATGGIAWEAVLRFREPASVDGGVVIIVAAVALVVNGLSAWNLMAGSRKDLNVRGAFLHLLSDAGVSAGVIVSGALVMLTGWSWIDPVTSLLIAVFIGIGTWNLFAEAIALSLDAVPEGIELGKIQTHLARHPGVTGVHDLHVWAMSTTENALSAHLVVTAPADSDKILATLAEELHERFEISHTTLQIETTATPLPCVSTACDSPTPSTARQ